MMLWRSGSSLVHKAQRHERGSDSLRRRDRLSRIELPFPPSRSLLRRHRRDNSEHQSRYRQRLVVDIAGSRKAAEQESLAAEEGIFEFADHLDIVVHPCLKSRDPVIR
jgi:hypothetical protein